jgi:hypothetical protein
MEECISVLTCLKWELDRLVRILRAGERFLAELRKKFAFDYRPSKIDLYGSFR